MKEHLQKIINEDYLQLPKEMDTPPVNGTPKYSIKIPIQTKCFWIAIASGFLNISLLCFFLTDNGVLDENRVQTLEYTFAPSEEILYQGDSTLLKPYENYPRETFKTSPGIGPVSEDILLENSQLEFLGTVNGRSYYIDRTNVTWDGGRKNCQSYGLQIATFPTKSDSSYVFGRLFNTDRYVWTGAAVWYNYGSYRWASNNESLFPTPIYYFLEADTALVLNADSSTTSGNQFVVALKSRTFYTVCFQN